MLGSMVFEYFKRQGVYEVHGTVRHIDSVPASDQERMFLFDAESESVEAAAFWELRPDYIINGIGIIKPYCKDDDRDGVLRAIKVNSLFPHLLARAAEKQAARVLQIATDCVYAGARGNYLETDLPDALDVYGKTKSLGEVISPNVLHLRTSVVGPERKGKLNLLEWFLNQPAGTELKGFAHHYWNGITTLQFAQIAHAIIEGDFSTLRQAASVYHYVPNAAVNKFELLNIFVKVFHKNFHVTEVTNIGPAVNRVLATKFDSLYRQPKQSIPMEQAVAALQEYTDSIHFYKP